MTKPHDARRDTTGSAELDALIQQAYVGAADWASHPYHSGLRARHDETNAALCAAIAAVVRDAKRYRADAAISAGKQGESDE